MDVVNFSLLPSKAPLEAIKLRAVAVPWCTQVFVFKCHGMHNRHAGNAATTKMHADEGDDWVTQFRTACKSLRPLVAP